ncbi:hypothetical protein [Hydrogenovibrio sp. JE_KL2]|uniref:hypothetical protein n=1 Tax=Hydrogenovibrio sp. JE_KL2 TaxID=2651188 RepID=UPI00128DC847|nr:hypothetical protein [Hydrogenovibrio sp. JE_KL2]MPQ76328.1 hypothetical protein [Hydrogenovibrio sp. JE_KL2]
MSEISRNQLVCRLPLGGNLGVVYGAAGADDSLFIRDDFFDPQRFSKLFGEVVAVQVMFILLPQPGRF